MLIFHKFAVYLELSRFFFLFLVVGLERFDMIAPNIIKLILPFQENLFAFPKYIFLVQKVKFMNDLVVNKGVSKKIDTLK